MTAPAPPPILPLSEGLDPPLDGTALDRFSQWAGSCELHFVPFLPGNLIFVVCWTPMFIGLFVCLFVCFWKTKKKQRQ